MSMKNLPHVNAIWLCHPHINPIQMICLSFHEVIDRVAQHLTLIQKGQMAAITGQFKSIGMQEQ